MEVRISKRGSWSRGFWRRRAHAGGEPLEVGFDGGRTGRQLALIPVKEFEVLLEHEDVLRAAGDRWSRCRASSLEKWFWMAFRLALRAPLPSSR